MGRAGLEACVGSMEEGDQHLPTGRSWPLAGQGHVWRQLWAFWSLDSLSADRRGYVPAQLVVWPELAQHWHLRVIGWAGLGANKLQQVRLRDLDHLVCVLGCIGKFKCIPSCQS